MEEEKTPEAFRNACHKFILTENLRPLSIQAKKTASKSAPAQKVKGGGDKTKKPNQGVHVDFLKEAVEKTCDEEGWVHLGKLGSYIRNLKPDFDPRSANCRNLSELFKLFSGTFEMQDRAPAESAHQVNYVRIKQRA